MERNNGLQRPSMNESDPRAVPCLSHDSAAAAGSYHHDLWAVPCSFHDAKFPELFLPVNSHDPCDGNPSFLKMIVSESLLALSATLSEDELFGFQSSEIDWDSVVRSYHGATVPPSRNNLVSLENQMNEEYAVDSLPQAPQQSTKAQTVTTHNEVNDDVPGDQCDRLLPTMISDKDKTQTSFYNSFETGSSSSHPLQIEQPMLGSRLPPKASRPSSSAGGQRISLEPHNLHVRFEVTVPKFIVEVPRTDSSGFLKKAILEKVTAMELRTNVPFAYSINSMAAIICSEVNGSLDLVPGCQKVKASKSKKRPVMDVNSLDMGPAPQKSKLSKNEKRRETEPFSTYEVEVLVQKIEEHGIGSWAKIKDQAFGHSSRTRTDLRDKWRSLVKTAKMPADKRKGGPLPQELLDKVVEIETRNSQCRDIQK